MIYKLKNPDYFLCYLSVFFISLFAFWTIFHQISTFINFSWLTLTTFFNVVLIPLVLVLGVFSHKISNRIRDDLVQSLILQTNHTPRSICILFLATASLAIFLAPSYTIKFLVFFIFVLVCTPIKTKRTDYSALSNHIPEQISDPSTWFLLMPSMLIALFIVLFSHRSDADDAQYLQLAMQTLRYPNLAPHSFDASLGTLLPNLRFFPYRFVSYETFIAYWHQISGLPLLSLYYFIFPSIAAILTISISYIFNRLFFTKTLAALASVVFLIIIIAWGEDHISYGNRMLVRIFQGKSYIITVTTPLLVIFSILVIRTQKLIYGLLLLLVSIAAVGFSSSAILTTFLTLICTNILYVILNFKKLKLSTFASLSIGLVYALVCGVSIKLLQPANSVQLSDIGTFLPINASFGGVTNESILLISIMAFHILGLSRNQLAQSQFASTCVIFFVIVFNPFLSELIAAHTSKNQTWRLGWSLPIPLFYSAIVAYGICLLWQSRPSQSGLAGFFRSYFALILISVSFLTFIANGPWITANANRFNLGWPSYKVDFDYYLAQQWVAANQPTGTDVILAPPAIGNWLTVLAPQSKLVMPGHTYSIALSTILDADELKERLALLKYNQDGTLNRPEAIQLINKYRVSKFILQ